MSKRLDNLNRIFLELQDRYGSDDSVVLQVRDELAACETMESMDKEKRLPFGERRVAKPTARFWNVRARQVTPSRQCAGTTRTSLGDNCRNQID